MRIAVATFILAFATSYGMDARKCAKVLGRNVSGTYESVEISLPSDKEDARTTYRRTGRGIVTADEATGETVAPYHNPKLLQELIGLRVLDLATGGGTFVEDCRSGKLGSVVEADGTDIYLSPEQEAKAYFRKADGTSLPYQDATFDRVFSTMSFFWHESRKMTPASKQYLIASLKEVTRVLKVGGVVSIGPVDPGFESLLTSISGLKLTRSAPGTLAGGIEFLSVELTRTH